MVDLLKQLKRRLDESGSNLEMIIVDDCCHVKNLYEHIFPRVKLRLHGAETSESRMVLFWAKSTLLKWGCFGTNFGG